MLISEDVQDIFEAAFAPLLAEIEYLQRRWPELKLQLLGHDLHLPGLQDYLLKHLPAARVADPEPALLLRALQHVLKDLPA